MTTKNLDQDGINKLRAVIHHTADDVRRQASMAATDVQVLEAKMAQDERDAAIVARLLQQQNRDAMRPLNEEESRLDQILASPQTPSAHPVPVELNNTTDQLPTPVPVPPADELLDQLYTREAFMNMSDQDLSRLAECYGITAVPRIALVDAIVVAQHDWCELNEADDPNAAEYENDSPRGFSFNSFNRDWMQWIGAVLGALVALMIALSTDGFGPKGFIHSVIATVWVIVILIVGFGFGGLIGHTVERLRRHSN